MPFLDAFTFDVAGGVSYFIASVPDHCLFTFSFIELGLHLLYVYLSVIRLSFIDII